MSNTPNTPKSSRPLYEIAMHIGSDWTNIKPEAASYLDAMDCLVHIEDTYYGVDTAESIVLRFLANASGWRGETARAIKSELKAIVSNINRELADRNHRAAYGITEPSKRPKLRLVK